MVEKIRGLTRKTIIPGNKVNWFGWDIDTIAAVYETDMACTEYEQGLINVEYLYTAHQAEVDLDPRFKGDSVPD